MVFDNKRMTGPEKAAMLLVSMGDELAGQVLARLDEQEIHKLSSYMNAMGAVSSEKVNLVLEEFIDMIESGQGGYVVGGKDFLRKMLEKTLDPQKAAEIMDKLVDTDEAEQDIGGGLDAVRSLDAKTVASFLNHEHPQTCAIILSHVDPAHAAAIIKELPESFQPDVTYRIATLERIPPGVIKELDQALGNEFRSAGAMEGSQIGGVEAAAEIINSMDRATEMNVLSEIEAISGELAEGIRQLMFVFEDLLKIDDRGMQAILKEVNSDELLIALKSASEPLKEKIFSNMSERAALMMKEDLEAMGPVRITDVEKGQQGILSIVKRMEEEGKVVIAGGGEELV